MLADLAPRDATLVADAGHIDAIVGADTGPDGAIFGADTGAVDAIVGADTGTGDAEVPEPDVLDLSPPEALCDGLDDDGDGVPDDGFDCALGESAACPTPCGTPGTHTCLGGCVWSVCVLPREVCNGVDDNCDGRIDETMPCRPGQARACRQGCGPEGIEECDDACRWRPCTGAPVSCEPECIADPSACRAPPTQCLLDADHDGWIDPGALELGPPDLISYTNQRSWSEFRYAVADGGERVYGSWCETTEESFDESQCVIQEFDGRGRATARRVFIPWTPEIRGFGILMHVIDRWLVTMAAGESRIYDLDLNEVAGPIEHLPPGGTLDSWGQAQYTITSWRCGDSAICAAHPNLDGPMRGNLVWRADLEAGTTEEVLFVGQNGGGPLEFTLPLPGREGIMSYALPCRDPDQACHLYFSAWTDDRIDTYRSFGPTIRAHGDPLNFASQLEALDGPFWYIVADGSVVPMASQPNLYVIGRDVDPDTGEVRRKRILFRGILTGLPPDIIPDDAPELNFENYGGHLLATFWGTRSEQVTIHEFQRGELRELTAQAVGDANHPLIDNTGRLSYLRSLNGQARINHLRCTRERIIADAP